MNIKRLLVSIATLGPVGYVRGSGTLATIITLPIVYAFYTKVHWAVAVVLAVVAFAVAVVTVRRALRFFEHKHDPSEIVMDEVVGCLITFYGVPITWSTLLIGFLLFRFFDIVKPLGINKVQRLPGVWGVIFDDIIAGVLSNVILYFIYYYLLA